MSENSPLERNTLWAPWRIKYIQGLGGKGDCFLCDYLARPEQDAEHHVLWRTEHAIVVFNKFPYNNGHLLIAPKRHIPDFEQATDEELLVLMRLVRDSQRILKKAIAPHGFNVGMNFGRCAGAGLPEHVHIHVVPRWNGDTNFMPVCNDTDVISQGLDELYRQLVELSENQPLGGSGG
ncbi:MAG: HIT domain-containing protein [Planctomycetes bacterium]|jgi:ATP adenylyltransferase|nr:HIT domain-containing protein [Planctomycetota bacterium]